MEYGFGFGIQQPISSASTSRVQVSYRKDVESLRLRFWQACYLVSISSTCAGAGEFNSGANALRTIVLQFAKLQVPISDCSALLLFIVVLRIRLRCRMSRYFIFIFYCIVYIIYLKIEVQNVYSCQGNRLLLILNYRNVLQLNGNCMGAVCDGFLCGRNFQDSFCRQGRGH